MNTKTYVAPMLVLRANDNDALIPELWANEGVAILEENMVMANLVHRDFSNQVAEFGDVVNTRKPGEFGIRRKTDTDSIETQDASATNIRVPLDQHAYVSFTIKDGEASKSFQDLIDIYLLPGMQSVARAVDRSLLGRAAHELILTTVDRVGRLGALTGSTATDTVLDAREVMNVHKAYMNNRNLVLSPSSETALLKNDLFIKANERGDGGTALENARLGRILGFDTYMDQNVNSLTDLNTEIATGDTDGAEVAGEAGSIAVTVTGYEANVGEFANIAGNDQPTHLTAVTAATNTTAITLNEALKYAVESGAVVTIYKAADVDGAYAAGYAKNISIDGFAANKGPQVGQLIAFGTGGTRHTYTVINSEAVTSTNYNIWLDRPLETALANNDLAFPGPSGSFNIAFHRDALALVSRPLARPRENMGAMFDVAIHNDLSMRVTMQYNATQQGTIVTLDMLYGVQVLDTDLAVLMLG
jgi:hypothetical protein